MNLSNKRLLAIALILSTITSGLVYYYLRSTTPAKVQDMVTVVVAKTDIPPKTVVSPSMVEIKRIPAAYVRPNAINDLDVAVGKLTLEYIAGSEQLTKRQLLLGDKPPGFTGLIPPDRRAITVAVNEVKGVAGLVKPGDYVDVVATFAENTVGMDVSRIMLQNILVLAVNRNTGLEAEAAAKDEKSPGKAASTVTLAVTPAEATKLTLAASKGEIHLALRPYLPAIDYDVALPVTPQDIVGSQKLAVAGAPLPPDPAPAPAAVGGIQLIRGTSVEIMPLN